MTDEINIGVFITRDLYIEICDIYSQNLEIVMKMFETDETHGRGGQNNIFSSFRKRDDSFQEQSAHIKLNHIKPMVQTPRDDSVEEPDLDVIMPEKSNGVVTTNKLNDNFDKKYMDTNKGDDEMSGCSEEVKLSDINLLTDMEVKEKPKLNIQYEKESNVLPSLDEGRAYYSTRD